MATVTFDGTRLNDADANTGWGNFVIGGGAPASEFPLAYQVTSGTTTGAVNKKITSSAARQGVDYNGTSVDMTSSTRRLLFLKCYISDAFDLNATWGVELAMGSADTSNSHRYNIAGSGANLSVYSQYPAQGGYLITSVDPTIDAWAETTDQGGTFDQTAVVWYAIGAQFINGTAKTENVAFDSIDIGTGLTITGTASDYPEFVATDQDTKANRWGVVTGSGDNVRVNGLLTIGTATSVAFSDTTSVVVYPDGYHSRGLVGVLVNLNNASTTVLDGALHIGEGTRNGADANDTRPDYEVVGTTQTSAEFTPQLRNFRDVTFTSVCDVHDFDIECHLLVQNSADIYDGVIRCNALTSEACLQDPTFGTTTDLRDCDFIQVGAGHAIEIDTATSYTMTGLTFTGFGADTTDDAALDVTASSGTVTITLVNMSQPTYKSAGATVVFVASPVTTSVTVLDARDNSPLENARVLVTAGSTGDEPFEDSVTITSVTTTATVAHTAHGLSNGEKVLIAGVTNGNDYNGVKTISNVSTNAYDYTVDAAVPDTATGTITSTGVIIEGLTNASGLITDTRPFSADQSIGGIVRRATGPFASSPELSGTIDTADGLAITVQLIYDA